MYDLEKWKKQPIINESLEEVIDLIKNPLKTVDDLMIDMDKIYKDLFDMWFGKGEK